MIPTWKCHIAWRIAHFQIQFRLFFTAVPGAKLLMGKLVISACYFQDFPQRFALFKTLRATQRWPIYPLTLFVLHKRVNGKSSISKSVKYKYINTGTLKTDPLLNFFCLNICRQLPLFHWKSLVLMHPLYVNVHDNYLKFPLSQSSILTKALKQ